MDKVEAFLKNNGYVVNEPKTIVLKSENPQLGEFMCYTTTSSDHDIIVKADTTVEELKLLLDERNI